MLKKIKPTEKSMKRNLLNETFYNQYFNNTPIY